jgi:hypothetical protein
VRLPAGFVLVLGFGSRLRISPRSRSRPRISASDREKRLRSSEAGGLGFEGGVDFGARLVVGAAGHASWRTPRAEALAQDGLDDPGVIGARTSSRGLALAYFVPLEHLVGVALIGRDDQRASEGAHDRTEPPDHEIDRLDIDAACPPLAPPLHRARVARFPALVERAADALFAKVFAPSLSAGPRRASIFSVETR